MRLSRFMRFSLPFFGARTSVFSLSDKAGQGSSTPARNENKADLIGGPDLGSQDPLAANVLPGMFQRETMNDLPSGTRHRMRLGLIWG